MAEWPEREVKVKRLGMLALLLLTGCDEYETKCDDTKRSEAVLVCMYDHYKTDPSDRYARYDLRNCEAAAESRFCRRVKKLEP